MPVVMRFFTWLVSVWEAAEGVGAYQVDHVHYVPAVPEAVCPANNQFVLVGTSNDSVLKRIALQHRMVFSSLRKTPLIFLGIAS